MWWLLAACGGPSEPEIAPDPAAVAADAPAAVPLDDLLQQAAEKGAVGDASKAIALWTEAYANWERTTEPRVRKECDRCATEIEYTFGRLRAEIAAKGGRPQPILAELRSKTAKWLPPAPPPE